MSGGGAVVLVLLVLIIGLVIGLVQYYAAKQRRDEIAAYAASHGWRYVQEEPALVDRFTGSPFGLGFGRRAFNVVYGNLNGRDLVSYDYVYKTQTSNGKTTTTVTHPFSVLALSLGAAVPPLVVDPEGFFDRIVDSVTDSDIDLESEDFNRAFVVHCPDRKFASDVLNPQMMEYLLQYRLLGWRFDRDALLVIGKGKRTPRDIDATIAVMSGITQRIPEFVWARVRGEG